MHPNIELEEEKYYDHEKKENSQILESSRLSAWRHFLVHRSEKRNSKRNTHSH